MKRKLLVMAVIFTMILSQFTLMPMAESVIGDMDISLDGNYVLCGHDITAEAVHLDEYELDDPSIEWYIKEEINVTGSSIEPQNGGRTATITAGDILDRENGDEPTIVVEANLYEDGILISSAVYDCLRVCDEYYGITFDGYDFTKPLMIGESAAFTCSLYRYNQDHPSGELISGSNVDFNLLTYEDDYGQYCTVSKSGNSFTVTRLDEGNFDLEFEATIDGERYNTTGVYFKYPEDCELYFEENDDRNLFSDGDMTLETYSSGLDDLGSNLRYVYDVKIIDSYDPAEDEYTYSDLPDPNIEYFTGNGTSVTLHGDKLWAAVSGREDPRLEVRVEAVYGGKVLADADTYIWVKESGFYTYLESLEEEKTLVNTPVYIEKYRDGMRYGSEYPEGEEIGYTVSSIVRESGTAAIKYNKDDEEWRIIPSSEGKSVFKMTFTVDDESDSRTAYFTVDAVKDIYYIDWTKENSDTYALPGDSFELAVNASHVNYKDPDNEQNDYTVDWSIEGDAKEYASVAPDGKKAVISVTSDIPDSAFDDGEMMFTIRASMIAANGDVVGTCTEEYILTNDFLDIILDQDEYKVPLNGSFTINPTFVKRSFASGVTTEEVLNAAYTFEYEEYSFEVADGQGNYIPSGEYVGDPSKGPFTIKRVNPDDNEISIYAWDLDSDENDYSKVKQITLNELFDIADAGFDDISAKTYNGKAQKPVPVLYWDDDLVLNKDFKVAYKNNTNAGTATITVTGIGDFYGKKTIKFTIKKAANSLKVKAKTATVKYSSLKKKNQTLAVSKVITFTKKGQGTMSYTKSKGDKKITIDKKTGKVTVKKGLAKGTYKVKVKVKAAGNSNYSAKTLTVTFSIKVK